MTQNIPKKVDLAALPSDSLEMLPGGVLEPFVIVGNDQVHSTEPPALQVLQHGVPGGFVFAVPQGQSQDLPLSLGGDSGGDQGSHRRHTLISSHPNDQGVDQHNGYGPDSFRFFQAWTRAESPVDNWLTVDFENRVPHSSPVRPRRNLKTKGTFSPRTIRWPSGSTMM